MYWLVHQLNRYSIRPIVKGMTDGYVHRSHLIDILSKHIVKADKSIFRGFYMGDKDIFDYIDEIKDAWHSEFRSSRAFYYWIFLFWTNMFFQKLFDAVAILSKIDFKTLKLNSSVLIDLGAVIAPVTGIGILLCLLKSKIVFEYRVEHFTRSLTKEDVEELLAKIKKNEDDQNEID